MYFIFEVGFSSNKNYISNMIRAYVNQENMDVDVVQAKNKIFLVFNKEDKNIDKFLFGMEKILPASLFLSSGRHYFADEKPSLSPVSKEILPVNIAPCPACQKEMFDVSSRRYYYPFTSCNYCGSQRSFLSQYPYTRSNTTMKFLVPCQECAQEAKSNVFRLDYPLISCIECGISIRMLDKENEHLALNKGDLRKLFEVSARAISSGKTILVKTANGYKKFFKPTKDYSPVEAILLITDANSAGEHLMMINEEFNSLLSIERPLLRIATKSDALKSLYSSAVLAKYPDDGMSMLLAKELMNIDEPYVCYIECDSDEDSDFLIDFDMPINAQKDFKLFINQGYKLFVSGERVVYPTQVQTDKKTVTLANNLACVSLGSQSIIDSIDVFKDIDSTNISILDSEDTKYPKDNIFNKYESSMMSVIVEHNKIGKKAIGVHFDGSLNFLYYNGDKIINAVPAVAFESDNLWEKIASLREGSDRLVGNYKKAYPDVWDRLDKLDGNMDIFEVTAIALGLEDESLEGISIQALSFLGKGGLQIDTQVKDNRFDNYAFLTSVMSYQLGDVENDLMCYSIYESFGDYIGEIVPQLADKVKTDIVTLSGESFANQSLYARISRTLGKYKPIMNKNIPIGKENAVYGGVYL